MGLNLTDLSFSARCALDRFVWCGICHQRPWRVVQWNSVMDISVRLRAWCHGDSRVWAFDLLVLKLGGEAMYRAIRVAMVAFPAMLVALPPILVNIRRLRGRRLPLPTRDRFTVWCVT